MAMTGAQNLILFARGSVFSCSIILYDLVDWKDGSIVVPSTCYTSFEGIKLACVPIVDIIKRSVLHMLLCI